MPMNKKKGVFSMKKARLISINALFKIFFLIPTLHLEAIQIPIVNFFNSMQASTENGVEKLNSLEWKAAEILYNKYAIEDFQYSDKPKIPKIIHQVWIGSPFPEKYKALQKTWIANHPDWEYKLWTDKEIKELGLYNQKLYDSQTNLGIKSDIAKAEILYRFGGLYVDTDFECLQPFDVFHHTLDFYVGAGYDPNFMVFFGLVGSTPGHPILKECIESYDLSKIYYKDAAVNVLFTTGPYHLTKAFKKIAFDPNNTSRIVAFPVSYFYPWPWQRRDQNTRQEIEQWVRPETYGIHHWHVSWNNGKAPGTK